MEAAFEMSGALMSTSCTHSPCARRPLPVARSGACSGCREVDSLTFCIGDSRRPAASEGLSLFLVASCVVGNTGIKSRALHPAGVVLG